MFLLDTTNFISNDITRRLTYYIYVLQPPHFFQQCPLVRVINFSSTTIQGYNAAQDCVLAAVRIDFVLVFVTNDGWSRKQAQCHQNPTREGQASLSLICLLWHHDHGDAVFALEDEAGHLLEVFGGDGADVVAQGGVRVDAFLVEGAEPREPGGIEALGFGDVL